MKIKKLIYLFSLLSLLYFNAAFCNWTTTKSLIISNASTNVYVTPKILINNSGYSTATWSIYDGVSSLMIQAAISTDFGVTWSGYTTIDNFNLGELVNMSPEIALDDFNHAIIVWQKWNDILSNWEVKVTPYGSSNLAITTLDPNASNADDNPPRPKIVMDNNGHAIAIWGSETGGDFFTKAAVSSDFGETWSLPYTLDISNPSNEKTYPKIVMDNSGNAIATWFVNIAGLYHTKVARSSDFGKIWSSVKLFDPLIGSGNFTFPNIAMDNQGNAILIWSLTSGAIYPKISTSSNFGKTWSDPIILDSLDPSLSQVVDPQISMDNLGNAVAAWAYDSSGIGNSYVTKTAKSSDFGTTWSSFTKLDQLNVSVSRNRPILDMDKFGNAVIVWARKLIAGNFEIRSAYSSDFGTTWSINLLDVAVEVSFFPNWVFPNLAMDKGGNQNAINAIAIWASNDSGVLSTIGTKNFQTITLRASGLNEKLVSFLQIALRNKISIDPIGQQGTFKLYKDAYLAQPIDSFSTSHQVAEFIDDNIKKDKIHTYYIIWVDTFGNVTGPISITIKS